MIRLLIAIVAMVALYRGGIWMIRTFGTKPPGPPPEGEMRRIKLNYRCELCGTELRITRAVTDDPPPPRHCMEEMTYMPGFED